MTYPASDTADVTVSTAAAVNSQIDAWEADWSGTVPAGKTTSDERMIALDTSTSSDIDLAGRSFPQMVWVRSAGTFTDYDCSVKCTGNVSMIGSTNCGVYLLHIIGGERLKINQTTTCAATRCFLQGTDVSSPSTTEFDSPTYTIDVENGVTSFEFEDCVLGWSQNAIYLHSGTINNLTLKGCVFDWVAGDSVKQSSTLRGFTLWNCWFARNISGSVAGDFHEDWMQQQGGSTDGATIRGCVGLLDDARRYNGSAGVQQGIFYGDGYAGHNMDITQNIFASNTGVVAWKEGSTSTGTTCDYNTAIHVTTGGFRANMNAGTRDYNWTMSDSPGFDDSGAGSNGICIDISSLSSKDLSVADTYFEHGCPVEGDPIGHYEPKANTAMHWDYSGTKVGAYERFEELFSLGGSYVPGNVGWPVAKTWEDAFNDVSPQITTTYSGSYDSNGDNLGTAPSISALTINLVSAS